MKCHNIAAWIKFKLHGKFCYDFENTINVAIVIIIIIIVNIIIIIITFNLDSRIDHNYWNFLFGSTQKQVAEGPKEGFLFGITMTKLFFG